MLCLALRFNIRSDLTNPNQYIAGLALSTVGT